MSRKLPVRATLLRVARAYRAHYVFLIATALLVFGPLGALEVATEVLQDPEGLEDVDTPAAGVLVILAIVALGSTLGDQFYSGLVEEAVAEWLGGRRRPPFARLVRSRPFLRLVAVDLIVAIGTLIGLLLLIVPGVLVFTWFSLAAPVIAIERPGVRAALRRSRALVRGNFWRVLGILGSLLLLTEALTEPLQLGLGELLGDDEWSAWLGAVIAGGLFGPISALAAVVITYELIGFERSGATAGRPDSAGFASGSGPRAELPDQGA